MKYFLTGKQKDFLRWLVSEIRAGRLQETFSISEYAGGSSGLIGSGGVDQDRLIAALDSGQTEALREAKLLLFSTSEKKAGTLIVHYRTFTLTGLAYEAVDSNFANPSPKSDVPGLKTKKPIATLDVLELVAAASDGYSATATKEEFALFRELEANGYIVGQIGPDTHDAPPRMVEDVALATNGRLLMEKLQLARETSSPHLATKGSRAAINKPPSVTMDIFISHSSKDKALAGALAMLFQIGLVLDSRRIRCTSVDGFNFALGAKTDEHLKAEVHQARVLVGLITPASVHSSYVLFELGARWGLDKFIGPVLAKGAPASLLPGPIAGINALHADNEEQVHQLLRDVANELELPVPNPSVYNKFLKDVVRLASVVESAQPNSTESAQILPEEQERILQLLWESDSCSSKHIAAKTGIKPQDAEFHINELEGQSFIYVSLDSDEENPISIKQEGRRYLKKRKLV